jgi:DNA anti-recombination protein RmuC
MSREKEISARARKLFARRDRLEAQLRAIDAELSKARSEYRQETRVFINDMPRFRNAVHQIKVAA